MVRELGVRKCAPVDENDRSNQRESRAPSRMVE